MPPPFPHSLEKEGGKEETLFSVLAHTPCFKLIIRMIATGCEGLCRIGILIELSIQYRIVGKSFEGVFCCRGNVRCGNLSFA